MTEQQVNEKHVETMLEAKDCSLLYWNRAELEALRRLITKELRQRKTKTSA